jgi:uncharacterized protein YqjF (DUF2071 family)
MPEIVRQAPRFLTAGWYHLVMLNYPVQPAALAPYVPVGTEIDFHDGRTYLSVVGFYFCDTRLMGIPVPFHRHFEEVNLRFYVRARGPDGWRRGVVFIKEIAPRRMVTWVARALYNENYVTMPMRHALVLPAPGTTGSVRYEWYHRGRWDCIRAQIEAEPAPVAAGSEQEFITEHYWGYVRQRDGSTMEYQVEHPPWRVWAAHSAQLDCDTASLYGNSLGAFLQGAPASAFVADGSPIVVRRGRVHQA